MKGKWGMLVIGALLVAAAVLTVVGPGRPPSSTGSKPRGRRFGSWPCARWFTDHWKANLTEFEKLTGIKVVVEDYPEDPFRQKLAVEMSADCCRTPRRARSWP